MCRRAGGVGNVVRITFLPRPVSIGMPIARGPSVCESQSWNLTAEYLVPMRSFLCKAGWYFPASLNCVTAQRQRSRRFLRVGSLGHKGVRMVGE